MHIAFVTPVYPPENGWGGIGTYVYHSARALATRGHRVTIFAGYRERPADRLEGGLRVVRRIQTEGVNGLARSEQIASLLEQAIPRDAIDVVEFGEYGGDGAVFLSRHCDFPVVVKLHCPTSLCSVGEAPRWQAWLRRRCLTGTTRQTDRLERKSVARAKAAVAPSRWLFETLQQQGWDLPKAACVVPNPFGGWPEDGLAPSAQPKPTQQDGAARVLVLGRLARIKGADLLPEIFTRIWRQMPEVRFELVGQDTPRTQRETWREHVARRCPVSFRPNVIFHEGVPHAQLPGILALHRVALFASRLESSSYAVMECMWAGLACVVASQGGAQELGEHGISVLNVSRDPEQVAASVLRLLGDAALRLKIGDAARTRIRTAFDPARIAAEMESIYRQAGAQGFTTLNETATVPIPMPVPVSMSTVSAALPIGSVGRALASGRDQVNPAPDLT
jgi:glycosyltransferase involved in cell wall biosynthesis